MIFAKKRYAIFVGKRYIDPGLIVLKNEPLFYGSEALAYTHETLPEAFTQIKSLSKGRKIRVVLSEELVYVTEIVFPAGTRVTRELVREKAEGSIPEDLHKTAWDFQTLGYVAKQGNEGDISVQVAVVEYAFSRSFRSALEAVSVPIETILPESCVLAQLESALEGVSIVAEADREGVVFSAVENGSVIATCVKRDGETEKDLEAFLEFIALQKGKKARRIIFSHFDAAELRFEEKLIGQGYECLRKEYNPLVGIALQKKISGKDEEVLNIDMFSGTNG